jgi:hypothetical protein
VLAHSSRSRATRLASRGLLHFLSFPPSSHSPTISAFNFTNFTRLFTSTTTMSARDIPQQFRAAQFTQSGGELEMRETHLPDPRPDGASSSFRLLATY